MVSGFFVLFMLYITIAGSAKLSKVSNLRLTLWHSYMILAAHGEFGATHVIYCKLFIWDLWKFYSLLHFFDNFEISLY